MLATDFSRLLDESDTLGGIETAIRLCAWLLTTVM